LHPGLRFTPRRSAHLPSGEFAVPHKFSVGQIVDLLHRPLRAAVGGQYEVRHLMPPRSDGSSEDPSYRIKSLAESHERVAPESELTLSGAQPSFADRPSATPAAAGRPSPVQIAVSRGRVTNRLAANQAARPGRFGPH
jgi:hypothetical protein